MYEIVNGNEIILQFVSDNWIILCYYATLQRTLKLPHTHDPF